MSTTKKNNNNKKNKKKRLVRPKTSNPGGKPFKHHSSNPDQNIQYDRDVCWLDYEESITQFNNVGGPIVSGEYEVNNPYDFDTAILSNSTQFYNRQMQIYKYAKVITAKFVHVFDCYEQNPLEISCFHSTSSLLSTLGSRGQLESQEATALRDRIVVTSSQYGKKENVVIRLKLSMVQIVGNPFAFLASDDYSSTATAGPLRPLYMSWVVFSPLGTMPNGFFKRTTASLKILFYGTRPIPTPLMIKERETTFRDDQEKRRHQDEPTGNAQITNVVVAARGRLFPRNQSI